MLPPFRLTWVMSIHTYADQPRIRRKVLFLPGFYVELPYPSYPYKCPRISFTENKVALPLIGNNETTVGFTNTLDTERHRSIISG